MNLFQKSLEDIVKGSKNTSVDLTTYNFQCYQEMKEEAKSSDVNVKAKAILKYFYVNSIANLSLIINPCL